MPIRVLIVDDSALIRKLLTELIGRSEEFEVVGSAPHPMAARQMIKDLNPDVLTLDVEMPRMDGIEFLEKIMRLRPMPVVMISSLTQAGNDTTLKALELGAVDFITKPQMDVKEGLAGYVEDIHNKLRAAATARIARRPAQQATTSPPSEGKQANRALRISSEKLVFIGASTGGTEAIREVLEAMPGNGPGILITQHMPAGFTRSFAQRLNSTCACEVREARDQERVLPGCAYIAPGGRHMRIVRSGANYVIRLTDEAPVNRHKPSVDVLFDSAADHVGPNAVAALLTGMGNDGAQGMRRLHEQGATTYAQDEATSVVFGMPREAIEAGGVDHVLPLGKMADALIGALRGRNAVRI
ncbi:MAG: chemotaxis response regulator protein-glutamate methylesterase [Oleiphilaceae bacterium]|nr:chemotaxis response regulator protein-glutamate methylesterase [Oleiphilaceae bacterium]